MLYEYNYTEKQKYFHYIYSTIINDKLLLGLVDHENKIYQIKIISKDKEEVIYDENAIFWFLYACDDYIIIDELTSKTEASHNEYQLHNIKKVNLKDKNQEVLISSKLQLLYNDDVSSSYLGDDFVINDKSIFDKNGFAYILDNDVYYYDLNKKEESQILENTKYNYIIGNDKVLFSQLEDEIYFLVNSNSKFTDYYLKLHYSTNLKGINIINDNLYIYLEGALNRSLLKFDIENRKLYCYEYKTSELNGEFYFINNSIYFITRNQKKITIEQCTFNEV